MKKITGLLAAGFALFAGQAMAATLDDVKARGFINCGVSEGVPGFSNPNAEGDWKGFDVDMCRALSAAIFNDPTKIKFVPLASKQKVLAVVTGQVDLTSRTTTWTMKRDTKEGVDFTSVVFFDGQGFMTRKQNGAASAMDLNGATVCVTAGTTTELNLEDFARANSLEFEPVVFEGKKEAVNAYRSGRCDALTTDASQLAAFRITMPDPAEHVILPEIFSKEPLAPLVKHGDNAWKDLVTWTINGLITAEETGVTQGNASEQKASSKNPTVQRMLGVTGDYGSYLGLENDWLYNAIKAVGNYGEIYDRNLGSESPLNMPRGKNALWTKGGLLYVAPLR
ncbi:amino acid ABC transporter substrate-binding protein [Sneathiella chinensis]|uniref:Amino acid ABC transporter substrate-binding protein n=1 Tax=Sneathiella chinensis TaxID=349750 RepID=A0ABQ5U000_9PROT|nr:amino acid ABC transporter substrate-binding protein [Sneathiella chinensis]GLQ05153.1 amino acid ABC transporter substrate-binding protein [Sneathiella chinensis]